MSMGPRIHHHHHHSNNHHNNNKNQQSLTTTRRATTTTTIEKKNTSNNNNSNKTKQSHWMHKYRPPSPRGLRLPMSQMGQRVNRYQPPKSWCTTTTTNRWTPRQPNNRRILHPPLSTRVCETRNKDRRTNPPRQTTPPPLWTCRRRRRRRIHNPITATENKMGVNKPRTIPCSTANAPRHCRWAFF